MVLGVQNPVIVQCFRGLRAKNLRGGGGGVPPHAQDLHPQHHQHQDYLAARSLSPLFASDVGIGLLGVWVGPSAVIR